MSSGSAIGDTIISTIVFIERELSKLNDRQKVTGVILIPLLLFATPYLLNIATQIAYFMIVASIAACLAVMLSILVARLNDESRRSTPAVTKTCTINGVLHVNGDFRACNSRVFNSNEDSRQHDFSSHDNSQYLQYKKNSENDSRQDNSYTDKSSRPVTITKKSSIDYRSYSEANQLDFQLAIPIKWN